MSLHRLNGVAYMRFSQAGKQREGRVHGSPRVTEMGMDCAEVAAGLLCDALGLIPYASPASEWPAGLCREGVSRHAKNSLVLVICHHKILLLK